MIYGRISLENWRTAQITGEEPESFFETDELRLFFFGTLYNRDAFHAATSSVSNAHLAALAYLESSVDGLAKLDGSFLIVYYSAKDAGIVCDHHSTYGVVYITEDGYFSTSWQSLKSVCGKFSCNQKALSAVLQRGIYRKDGTPMVGVSRLLPGTLFRATGDGYIRHQLYSPAEPFIDNNPDIEAYSRRYGELHLQAIRRRIGDSKRVGILLSGGYDSGSNLAGLRSIYDGEINSYSVGFRGDALSELPMARLLSKTFGTQHHEYEIDGSEINALPDIIRFLQEPFIEGGLMVNYCAMRMIGDDKPEVILGGDGSDQYFGTSGQGVALHYLTARAGMRPLLRGINSLLDSEKFDTGGKLSRVRFHLEGILHLLEGEHFGFSDSDMHKLLLSPASDFDEPLSPRSDLRSYAHLYTQHAYVSDLKIVIDRIILYKASCMARMFGNKLTFPYMDLDLYHFLQKVPVGLKCKGDSVWSIARGHSTSKYLLKYHYKPLLPEAITMKKKQGGFAPMTLFFKDPVQRNRLKDFILSSHIYDSFLRRDIVEKFLTEYDRNVEDTNCWFWHRQNKALQYFNLLAVVTWWEEFIENLEVRY